MKLAAEFGAQMRADQPLCVVLAGPNGAGKSTIANELLLGALQVQYFVNADDIAAGLPGTTGESDVAAGRIMLTRLRELAAQRVDFGFETTLAGRSHARWLTTLRAEGYRTHLLFLSLPDPELAIARVRARVQAGGHDVPVDIIRRRYRAGVRNLMEIYVDVVDSWQVYDNPDLGAPRLLASKAVNRPPVVADRAGWDRMTTLYR